MQHNKRRRSLIVTAIALVAIPLAIGYTSYAISIQPEPEQSKTKITVPRVSIQLLNTGTHHSSITSFAEVRASNEISFSSLVAGRVIWRAPGFINGQQVTKNESLLRLDDTEYREALAIAQQNLAEAELILQQEKQQKSQAVIDWQRSGLTEKPGALVLRKPQLKLAKARFNAAKISVSHARRNLAETTVKAPFDGVILNRSASLGSFIKVGTVLATLRGSAEAEIVLTLSASQWQQLPQDLSSTTVQLSDPDQLGSRWQGEISHLSETIDPSTRQRSLMVRVKEPLAQQPPLLSGSFVSAHIKGRAVDKLFAIPSTALTADGYIWDVVDNRLQRHKSRPLFSANGKLYIPQSELPQQMALVVKPLASYLPGMAIEPLITEQSSPSLANSNGAFE
jgi:RND family efflux transporter MFP subunit